MLKSRAGPERTNRKMDESQAVQYAAKGNRSQEAPVANDEVHVDQPGLIMCIRIKKSCPPYLINASR
jgi:hypothetical protein